MNIEDVLPEKPEFTLSSGKSYRIRIPNVEDRIWLKKKFSEAEVKAAFNEQDWAVLSMIIYRLLEDKTDFMAFDEATVTDDGEQETLRVTGPQSFQRAICRVDDEISILRAFSTAFALSNPIIRDYVEAELKKKLTHSQMPSPQIGQESSTSSPQNMVGPSSKSESSRSGKSTSHSKRSKSVSTKD